MTRNNEAELKSTLESLPLPAYVFDGNAHRFIAVNRLLCDLLGYAEEELLNLPWTSLLANSDEVAAAQRSMDTPQFNVPIIFRGRHKNGSIVNAAVKYRDMRFVRNDGSVVDTFFAVVVSSEGEQAKPAIEVFKS